MANGKLNVSDFKKVHWSEQDKHNARLALEFVQALMNNHDLDYVQRQYADAPYLQHNRGMRDGIPGLVEYFQTLVKRFPQFSYDVKQVMVDGDLVTLHSHATAFKKHRGNDRKGFNIIDTWRIKDGKLAEHWDSIQPLDGFMRMYYWLTGGAVRNANGVF